MRCVMCDVIRETSDAVWWWQNDPSGLAGPLPICDEHAADKDLDDLQEIGARGGRDAWETPADRTV